MKSIFALTAALASTSTLALSPPSSNTMNCKSLLGGMHLASRRRIRLSFAPLHTDEPPRTPVKETERSSARSGAAPRMAPRNTEGFRDAVRGGQGYITPRGGSDGLDDHGNRGGRRGRPLRRFPKLEPGHVQDINAPPRMKQSLPEEEEGQQEQRLMQMKELQRARTARLNVLAGSTGKSKILPNILSKTNSQRQEDDVVDLSVGEEVCDTLPSEKKEHCIENFRDGVETAQFMKILGKRMEEGGTGRRNIFRRIDGGSRKSAGDSAVAVTASEFGDDEDEEEMDEELRDKILELSRDATLKKQERKDDKAPYSARVDRLDVIRGPQSENFRNGARMATFKQPEFGQIKRSYTKIEPTAEEDDEFKEDVLDDEEGREELDLLNDDFDRTFGDLELNDDEMDRLIDGGGVFDEAEDIEEEENADVYNRTTADYVMDHILRQKKALEEEQKPAEVEDEKAPSTSSATESKQPPRLLSIDPNSIEIIPLDQVKDDEFLSGAPTFSRAELGGPTLAPSELSQSLIDNLRDPTSGSFVKMFRGSASYIANHRSTLAVYHIPGELLAWEGFPGLMDDIALTWLLGMKIVLVAGCRHQIDIRLEDEDNSEHRIGGKVMMSSIRVTDEETLRVVKEEAGFVRFEIERRMAKSLRMHGGLVKGSENLVGNVVSGNFYSAQPFGVLDGIDYCWTGFPRKVEIERIRQVHETNDIVLLTSLGVSPSGEIFNVNSEFLAASVAGALGASKIIYFNVHGTSFQNKITRKPVQNLRVSDARNLLEHYKMRIHPKGFALVDLDEDSPHQVVLRTPGSMETLIKVGYSMVALEKGVKRAHILAPENGALVQELYTRDGCGTLISRDIYEGIRRADVNDVSGIYDLIEPLVRSGTLVERPKSQLEKEVLSYYVYTRDGLVVATGQLKRFEGGFAEIGCLVVSKDYRRGGRGDAMLGYLERLALQCGATKVFVLSTQTMEWFVERGFKEVPVASLPPSRQALYNTKRKSKIYMKEIDGDRDLDAAELWWSNKS